MDLDETTGIIDLCTPTLDNGDRLIVTQVSRNTSPFDTLFERFPNQLPSIIHITLVSHQRHR